MGYLRTHAARAVPLLVLAFLLTACSGGANQESAPAPPPPDKPILATPPPQGGRIYVSVIDGDRNSVVDGAVVRIGRFHDEVSHRGIARFRVPRIGRLTVSAAAAGYNVRTLPVSFDPHRWRTIRIYRRDLQWPFYGVDAQRTQAQTHLHVRPPFRTVWSRSIGTLIEFPAVVSDGMAYIGNFRGDLRAISMRSGVVAWRRSTNERMASSPAVVGNLLVAHTFGHVWLLNRWNGRVLWHYAIGSPIESSPVIRHGVDYFGSWNGNVYALDLDRRRLVWTHRSGYKITSSASIAGGTLFIGDYGGRLLALDLRNGRERWARSVNGRIYGTPAVASGRVFVPSSTGDSLTAFSTGGRTLWRVGTGGYVYSSPAVWGGRVLFGSYDGSVYCVSAANGRVLWRAGAGGAVSGAVVVVGKIAYAGSTAHRITGFDVRSGRTVFTFPHGQFVPVSGSGQRLLFHGYSRLYALEPRRLR